MESDKPKISDPIKVLMLVVAVFFDVVKFGINFIPILGQVLAILVGIFAQMTFWLWFKMKGVSYNSAKRLIPVISATLIGFVPFLDMIPDLTLEMIFVLGTLKAEEVLEKVPGGQTASNVVSISQGKKPEAAQNSAEKNSDEQKAA